MKRIHSKPSPVSNIKHYTHETKINSLFSKKVGFKPLRGWRGQQSVHMMNVVQKVGTGPLQFAYQTHSEANMMQSSCLSGGPLPSWINLAAWSKSHVSTFQLPLTQSKPSRVENERAEMQMDTWWGPRSRITPQVSHNSVTVRSNFCIWSHNFDLKMCQVSTKNTNS